MMFEKADLLTGKENFLHNLRHQTSHLHTDLEQLPASEKLMSNVLLKEDYVHYLTIMYAVNHHTENNIFPLLQNHIINIEERKKSHLILNDLNYLNAETVLQNFLFDVQHEKINTAVAFGIMYVIEGSTLGGRVILKNVNTVLGFTEEKGASYFAGYRAKTGLLWKQFLDELFNYETKHQVNDEIIFGANIAFKSIYNFFK